ncbi:hypothetical protein AM422_005506 [Klebsiella pneumoniae]|nr:hypothetical protein AM422_005506 [Klebsiella pneumoniae]
MIHTIRLTTDFIFYVPESRSDIGYFSFCQLMVS